MNTKYVLPASLAAAMHAFVLFGLPGKTPPTAAAAPADPDVGPDLLPIVTVEPLREDAPGPGEDASPGEGGGVRTLTDIPPLNPPGDAVFIRPSTKVDTRSPVTSIPVRWEGSGDSVGSERAIDPRFLDHEPRARVRPAPDYPYEARSRKIEGRVVVEFRVDEAGNVYGAFVRSSTASVFEAAALRAVSKWKFEPGTRHGRAVRFRMLVPIDFRMGDD